jgi:aminopeptidase
VKSPTLADLERTLTVYGDLAVTVGLNLQPGQRLLVIGPIANGGTSLDAAPLVRQIAASAYRAGARLVEVLWGDEALMLTRFRHARPESFSECSAWMPAALAAHADSGGAVISVYANDPDLLKGESPEVVGVLQQTVARSVRPFREHISRNDTNWTVVAAPSTSWAARVFPDVPRDQQVSMLWDAVVRLCRLDGQDPIDAWRRHIDALAGRRDYLNDKRYATLRYRGPGTDLSIGLPDRHVWVSARSVSRQGIAFTANIPTEEVFTMPHKDRVNGTVRGSKPVSHGGMLIEGFSMTFSEGRIVDVRAERGEAVLRQLVETDAGAARLGEIALVPDNSPISQSGLLFYNTLFDENAASHLALGAAYKFTLEGGEEMSPDDFGLAGGNQSATHVDFMIGSAALDIDGVRADGTAEPVMRAGDWAFDLG